MSRTIVEDALVPILPRLVEAYDSAVVCGSLRRGLPMVSDADIVCVGHVEDLQSLVGGRPAGTGPVRRSYDVGRVRIDVWEVPAWRLGAAVLYCTGPGLANIVMRRWARRSGLWLTFEGVIDETGRNVASATEEEVCDAIGWGWVPPELRFEDDRYYGTYLDVLNSG